MTLSLGLGSYLKERAQHLNSFSRQTSTDGHIQQGRHTPLNIVVLPSFSFNFSTTIAFVDPFRAPNYFDETRLWPEG